MDKQLFRRFSIFLIISLFELSSAYATGTAIVTGAGGIYSLAITPNGNTLYAADVYSGNVYPIYTSNGVVQSAIVTGAGGIYSLAITPNGNTLYAGDYVSGSVYPIYTSNGVVQSAIVTGASSIRSLAIAPNGNTLYAGNGNSGSVYPIYTSNGVVQSAIVTGGSGIYSLAIAPNGNTLYAGDVYSGNVYPIYTSNGVVQSAIVTGGSGIRSLAITPNGNTLYAEDYVSGSVYPIYTSNRVVQSAIVTGGSFTRSLAIAPNGNTLYAGYSNSGNVYPIYTSNGVVQSAIVTGASGIQSLAITPNGNTLYAGDGLSGNVYQINLIYTSPTITMPTVSNSVVDVGQSETISATISGGTGNFIGNFLISNAIPTLNERLSVPSQSGSIVSATWTVTANEIPSSTGNFMGWDSNTIPTAFNSIPSISFTVNNAMTSLSTTGATITNGQSNTITATWLYGSPSYAISLFSGASSSCGSDNTFVQKNLGISTTSNNFLVSPTSNTFYCIGIKDSATSNAIANQTTASEIIVNPLQIPPTASQPTVSNSVVEVGQTEQISSTISGGTGNFIGNFLISNAIPTLNERLSVPSQSGSIVSATWTVTANEIPSSTGNFMGWDSNTIPTAFNSIPSISFTVNNAMTSLSTTGATITNGQSNTITATWLYGSPSYAISLFSGASSSCGSDNTFVQKNLGISTTSNNFLVSPTSNTFYCIGIKDSATSNAIANQTTASEIIVNPLQIPPTASQPTVSNSVVEVGQTEQISSTISGGTGNFIGNFLISNAIPTLNERLSVPSQSGSIVSATWTVTANEIPSSTGNFMGWDSNTIPTAFNSIPSISFTVNNAMTSLSTTGATITNGQSNTITATWLYGSPSYAISLFSGASSSCGSDNTFVQKNLGISTTSNNFLVSPTSNTFYCIGIKDSATSNAIANQTTASEIIVNPLQIPPTVTISNLIGNILDSGQQFTLNGIISNGSPTFTVNAFIVNSITHGTIVASNTVTGAGEGAWSATFTTNALFVSNSPVIANVIVTDSNTIPMTANSVYTTSIIVNPALTNNVLSSSNPIVAQGQTEVLTYAFSGGSPNYKYIYTASNTVNGNIIFTQTFNGITLPTNSVSFVLPSTANDIGKVTITANVVDSATANSFLLSSNTITVNPTLSVSVSPSTATIDNLQGLTLTATASNGAGGYTYAWYSNAGCSTPYGGTASNQPVTPSSTTTYCVKVTDSSSATAIANSVITVDPTMSITSWTANSPAINVYQNQVVNVVVANGDPPYTYSLAVYNPSGTQEFSSVDSSDTKTSNTLSFSQTGQIGTWTANLIIDDNAYSPNVLTQSLTYNVYNITQALTFTNAGGNTIAYGTQAVANSILTKGTGTYSWAWTINGAGVSNTTVSTTQTSSSSAIWNVGTYTYNVVAIDKGLTAPYSVTSSNVLVVSKNTNPILSLTLNGVNGDDAIYPQQTIPVNVVSTTSNQLYLYRNGVLVDSANALSMSYSDTEANAGTVTFLAVANSINYTATSQTWTLTVNSVVSSNSISLVPTYIYKMLNNANSLSTSPNIFNLLSYGYLISASSVYGMNSITVSFGHNSLSGNQVIYLPNPLTYNAVVWDAFSNNAVSQIITITTNDVYGDLTSNTFAIGTDTYVYPALQAPNIASFGACRGTPFCPQAYTYTTISTPLYSWEQTGSFPISNTTFQVGQNGVSVNAGTALAYGGGNYVTADYAYTTNTPANALTLNGMVTDINGFSANAQTTGDQVLSYSYGTANRLTSPGYTANMPYQFLINQGTFSVSQINVIWGDGTNTTYIFSSPISSNTVALYHTYSIAQTYEQQVLMTDTSPNGGLTAQELSNQALTVLSYIPPTVSVMPNNRYNGANNNTENFTFYLQQGTASLQNMTVYWNDAGTTGHPATTNFVSLLGAGSTDTILHTFQFPIGYKTYVIICDTLNICSTIQTPINIAPMPLTQAGINQIANETSRQDNQSALNDSTIYQGTQNPTEDIIIGIIIVGASMTVLLVVRHNGQVRKRKRGSTEA